MKVIEGSGDQLFLGGGDRNDIANQISGTISCGHNDIVTWSNNLQHRKYLAEKFRFSFKVFICPEIHVINQQALPRNILFSEWRPVRVIEKLFSQDVVYLLKPVLENPLNEGRPFSSIDSHWTQVGAFSGYMEVLRTFGLEYKGLSCHDVVVSTRITRGDLGGKMNPPAQGLEYDVQVKSPDATRVYINNVENHGHVQHYVNRKRDGRILIFGTSFSARWLRYFAESFGEVLYTYTTVSDEFLIEQYRPDFVIFELPERFVLNPQSDLMRYPLIYSYISKASEHKSVIARDEEATGISSIISNWYKEINVSDYSGFPSSIIDSIKCFDAFVDRDPSNSIFIRDSTYHKPYVFHIFNYVDNGWLTSKELMLLPRTSAFSLGLIRALLRNQEIEAARRELLLYINSYGTCEEIAWFSSRL